MGAKAPGNDREAFIPARVRTPVTIRIREAADDDVEAIRAVAESAWYAALSGALDPAEIAAAVETYYDPELVAAGIEAEEVAFYVADAGEGAESASDGAREVVGFASAERTWADEAELHTIYVHPDRWGEGVGAALVEEVAGWARGEGVDRLACGVLADNAVGVGFFEAVGFRRGRTAEAEIVGSVREEYEYELPL